MIDLGDAASFAALAPAGIANTGATVLSGDLGTTGTSITGFPPGVVTGTIYINDNVTTLAQASSASAFTQGQALVATVDKASTATLGGEDFVPGVYKYAGGVGLSGSLTLTDNGSGVGEWVFQIATTLITSVGSEVILSGGAKASNVYWIVGSSATLGVGSTLQGNVLASALIAANTGATVNGGLYAGSSVTLDTNTVTV